MWKSSRSQKVYSCPKIQYFLQGNCIPIFISSLQHEFQPSSTGPHPSSFSSDLKATWAWKETGKDQSTHVVITRPVAN